MPGKPWRHEQRNIPGLWNHVLFSTEIRERSRDSAQSEAYAVSLKNEKIKM
jgi:hypothetical protein